MGMSSVGIDKCQNLSKEKTANIFLKKGGICFE